MAVTRSSFALAGYAGLKFEIPFVKNFEMVVTRSSFGQAGCAGLKLEIPFVKCFEMVVTKVLKWRSQKF